MSASIGCPSAAVNVRLPALSADEEVELKALVDAELRASAARASAIAAELGR